MSHARTLGGLGVVEQYYRAADSASLGGCSSLRWEEETDAAHQHQERTTNHAGINADEGIDIVHLCHQVGRECKTTELHPPLLADESAQKPDNHGIDRCHWQRQLTLCNLVLK